MRTHTALLMAVSFLTATASARAQPREYFADQAQAVADASVPLAVGGASEQKLAQTVTVGIDGRLYGVFLPVGCSSGRLVIEAQGVGTDGRPDGVVLWRRQFRARGVPPGSAMRFFRINARRQHLAAGDRFALVLSNVSGTCGLLSGPVGDPYAGGEGFFDARPNPPGWVPFSETETRLDLPFITVMMRP